MMKTRILLALLIVGTILSSPCFAKEKKEPDIPSSPDPIGWLEVTTGTREFEPSDHDEHKKGPKDLPQGQVLPVFKTKEKHGVTVAQVGTVNLDTGNAEMGWVQLDPAEIKPLSAYPVDSELLRLLGSSYLEDFVAEHTNIARFLLRQGPGRAALLCYVVAVPLSTGKLVLFTPRDEKYEAGASVDFSLDELHAGVTFLETRDLLGDGTDCVITHEPTREQTQTYGTFLRIRKIQDGQFQVLWQAPLSFHNFSQYPARIQILQPPERNVGAPGTVTTGDVTFRPAAQGQEPVWKGKVEYFVLGREKPVDAVKFEKACPWDGREFAPLD